LSVDYSKQNQLIHYFNTFIKNANIKNPIIKADILLEGDEINMIEMDIGVGGGLYYKKFIQHAYNFDITEQYINLITNNKVFIQENDTENTLVMDYIYNYKNKPIEFNTNEISIGIEPLIGENIIIKNLLNPGLKSSFETNADFILTIIHKKKEVSTLELNNFVNERFFVSQNEEN
jgi:hypothetical protein